MAVYLGLDVGTTYCAAVVSDGERLQVVPLDSHDTVVPAAVHVSDEGETTFAGTALRRGANDPAGLAVGFKRDFGDPVPKVLSGTTHTAHELTELLIGWIDGQVRRFTGQVLDKAVLTHPAHWKDTERELLARAASNALACEVALVTEPEAIAIHYATEREVARATVAVYDFGGGTFDATVIRIAGADHQILGTPIGRRDLGGIDLDDLIRDWTIEQVGPDVFGALDRRDPDVQRQLRRITVAAADAKQTLSTDPEAVIPVSLPGFQRDLRLTRTEFEARAQPLIDGTIDALTTALAQADVDPSELDATILAGGSSRVPLVSETIATRLGVTTIDTIHPKLAVAQGAALVAQPERPVIALDEPAEAATSDASGRADVEDGDAPDDGDAQDGGGLATAVDGRDARREDDGRGSTDAGVLDGGREPVGSGRGFGDFVIGAVLVVAAVVAVWAVFLRPSDDGSAGETVTDGVIDETVPTLATTASTSGASSTSLPPEVEFRVAVDDGMRGDDAFNPRRFVAIDLISPEGVARSLQLDSPNDCGDVLAAFENPNNYGTGLVELRSAALSLPNASDEPSWEAEGLPELRTLFISLLDTTVENLRSCFVGDITPAVAVDGNDITPGILPAWFDVVAALCVSDTTNNFLAPADYEDPDGNPVPRCPAGETFDAVRPEVPAAVVADPS